MKVDRRLVGRETELADLHRALEGSGGRPTAVLVTGEPGIGKSMLLRAALDGARTGGWHVLTAAADPLERQIPYTALARVLVPVTQDRNKDVASAAEELVATLEVRSAGLRPDVDSSFGRVCGQLTSLARILLERRCVALAVDDIDALDDDTLAVLAIIIRRLESGRFALLGTSRAAGTAGSPGFRTLLERLKADSAFHRIELGPLSPETVAGVIAPLLDAPPDRVLLHQIHSRADGNPFFAVELATSLRSSGRVKIGGGRARLAGPPHTLRLDPGDALVQRFTPLEQEARGVLEAIAVLGRVTTAQLDLLAAVTGLGTAAVADAFDAIVAAQILTSTANGYEFTHGLIRDAVYDRIGPAHRLRLHRAIAQRMAEERAAGRPGDVLALARHVAIASEAGDMAAVAILAEAGDQLRSAAPGSAAGFYSRAVELAPRHAAVRASLLARHSRALSLASRPAEAVDVGRAALDLLGSGGERTRTATTVISGLLELGRLGDALAIANGEIGLGDESPVISAHRAMILWHLRRFDEALREGCSAVARSSSGPAERVLVLGPLLLLAAYSQHPRPLPDMAAEMMKLGRGLPPMLDLYAAASASYALATSAWANEALAPLERAEALLEDVGGTAFRSNILVARVFVDWLQGRWDEGIGVALVELEDAHFAVQVAALRAIAIEIRCCRGERMPREMLLQLPPTPNMEDLRAWVIAGALEAVGDHEGARASLAAAVRRDRQETAYLPMLLARRIDVEFADQRRTMAAEALDELAMEHRMRPHPLTSVLLHRGRALLHRDPEEARIAVAEAGNANLIFERARAQVTLAEVDPVTQDALDEAYRTLQSLGADPLRRRAGALLKVRGMKVPRRRTRNEGPLTESETKVAHLVQQGLRNKEIASALHYSPRTVEVYLSRIYAKLAVSSRLELARALDAERGAGFVHGK